MLLLGLHWERPWALVGLALAALVLLLGLLPGTPTVLHTGTFRLWPESDDASGRARRRRPSLARVLLALACAAACLALAGPGGHAGDAPRGWVVVVDRSPSMGLASQDGRTRFSWALAGLDELARQQGVEELRFVDGADGSPLAEESVRSGELTLRGTELSTWRHDRAGQVLLTDREPADLVRAGFVASGGPAVPGVVSRGADAIADGGAEGAGVELRWDGTRLVPHPVLRAPRTLVLDPEVGAPWSLLVASWAEARGWRVAASAAAAGSAAGLRVRRAPVVEGAGAGAPEVLARDGWSLVARPWGVAPGAPWLTGADGRSRIGVEPGTVWLALSEAGEPDGDPAAFALSLGSLLDGAALPEPDVVPLEERRDAGAAGVRAPLESSPPGARGAAGRRAPVGLGVLAGLAGLAAWVLSSGGRRI